MWWCLYILTHFSPYLSMLVNNQYNTLIISRPCKWWFGNKIPKSYHIYLFAINHDNEISEIRIAGKSLLVVCINYSIT